MRIIWPLVVSKFPRDDWRALVKYASSIRSQRISMPGVFEETSNPTHLRSTSRSAVHGTVADRQTVSE